MEAPPIRIAMWSGPRTISTALMRSWGSRVDTAVVDEPFFSFYLQSTGKNHPGREESIASQPPNWQEVVEALLGPVPNARPIFYQKHMAHHLLPEIDREWLSHSEIRHAFLIREPRAMIASLAKGLPYTPEMDDTGLPQQVELFRETADRTGTPSPVIDSRAVLQDPEGMLRALCGSLDVPFDPSMLSWKPGKRETDGVWGKYWYANVWKSTGFGPPRESSTDVPEVVMPLVEPCVALYNELSDHTLSPQSIPSNVANG